MDGFCNLEANRNARDLQLRAAAAITLHEYAQRVAAGFVIELARRRADAAFETETDHAGPASHVAFGDGAGRGGIQRFKSVLRLDVQAIDVVQIAVVGLGHHRHRPPMAGLRSLDAPLDYGIAHYADAVRVGDHDRAFEKAGLLDPCGSGHFAIAIERKPRRENGIAPIFAARQDSGNARADGAGSHHELAVARDNRAVADRDTGDVGDGVTRACSAFERDAGRAGTRLGGKANGKTQKTTGKNELAEWADSHFCSSKRRYTSA